MSAISSSSVSFSSRSISFGTAGVSTVNGDTVIADDVDIANAALTTTSGNTVTLTTTDTANTTTFTMPDTTPQVGQMLSCSTGGALNWTDDQVIQMPLQSGTTLGTDDINARYEITLPLEIDNGNSESVFSSNTFTLGVGIWEISLNFGLSAGALTSIQGEFINLYDNDTTSVIWATHIYYGKSGSVNSHGHFLHYIVEVTSGTRTVSATTTAAYPFDTDGRIIVRKLK